VSGLHVVTDPRYAPVFRAWMAEHLGIAFGDDTRYVASVLDDGGDYRIVGCTAFNRWMEGSCEAHAATDGSKRRKIDRRYIWTCFDYAFNHAGKNCIVTHTAVDNHRSIALHEQLGLAEIGVIPGYYGEGKDARLYSITRQQWLDGKWGAPVAPGKENNDE